MTTRNTNFSICRSLRSSELDSIELSNVPSKTDKTNLIRHFAQSSYLLGSCHWKILLETKS